MNCYLSSLSSIFTFGKYKGLSLADVLDMDPSYLHWCIKHCTGVNVVLDDDAMEEIKVAYPHFIIDKLFEQERNWNCAMIEFESQEDSADEMNWKEEQRFERYAGSWAQDEAGYSDDEIDTIFDGDPSAYWNID